MDFLRTILLALVVAFIVYVAVYALFSLFTILGFWWSFLLLFVLFAILIGTMPERGNAGNIVVAQRTL